MGLIYKNLKLQGHQGRRIVNTLFDTGASQCFVRKNIAQEIAALSKAPVEMRFETATGIMETDELIFAQVRINGHQLFGTFIVVPELSEELILGADFFQRWKITLDPENEEIAIDPNALKMKLV